MRTLNTATENKRLLKLFWKLALWFCILLPIVNSWGLNSAISAINEYLTAHPRLTYGSRRFWEVLVVILHAFISFARICFHFFAYGLFTLSVYRFGWKSRHTWAFFGIANLCILIHPLDTFIGALFFTDRISSYTLLFALLNVLIVYATELLILLIVVLCNYCFAKSVRPVGFAPVGEAIRPRRHILLLHFFVMTLLHSSARLVYTILTTVNTIEESGSPRDFGDYLTLSEPYLALFLCSLLGYYTLALLTAAAESKVGSLCPPPDIVQPQPKGKKARRSAANAALSANTDPKAEDTDHNTGAKAQDEVAASSDDTDAREKDTDTSKEVPDDTANEPADTSEEAT